MAGPDFLEDPRRMLTGLAEDLIDLKLGGQIFAIQMLFVSLIEVFRKRGLLSVEDILAMCDQLDQSASASGKTGATEGAATLGRISLSLRNAYDQAKKPAN